MTKQEKIREGIARRLLPDWAIEEQGSDIRLSVSWLKAKDLMDYLHSQGVVIKVERELPFMFGTVESYLRGFEKMRKAGYSAFEPLI